MKQTKMKMKAQASIEFMALFPMFILLVLVLISLALQWHAFHVTSQGALEAASSGLARGASAAAGEAPYAEISIHKTGDAQVGGNVIESPYSKFVGFISREIMTYAIVTVTNMNIALVRNKDLNSVFLRFISVL